MSKAEVTLFADGLIVWDVPKRNKSDPNIFGLIPGRREV